MSFPALSCLILIAALPIAPPRSAWAQAQGVLHASAHVVDLGPSREAMRRAGARLGLTAVGPPAFGRVPGSLCPQVRIELEKWPSPDPRGLLLSVIYLQ